MPDEFDIDAGELNKQVTIQSSTSAHAAKGGQPILTWADVGNWRWASIKPASGQRFVASEKIRDATTHKIIMRWFPGLTPKHRIVYRGRVFNLLSVTNEGEQNVRYTVLATEVVA